MHIYMFSFFKHIKSYDNREEVSRSSIHLVGND